MYPASIYLYRNNIEGDPLPPAYTGSIYHYTRNSTATAIFKSGSFWASRYNCMNDPGENEYGWTIIQQHYQTIRANFSTLAQAEFDGIFHYDQHERWLGNAFILSASMAENRLDQFRFYGDTSLELTGGVWSYSQEEMTWLAHHRRAAWRPVLYNTMDAIPFIEDMLKLGAQIIDEPPAEDYSDESLVSMMALRHLALLIKHPEYKNEEEVRLVFETDFPSGDRTIDDVSSYTADGEEVFYVSAHPDPDAHSVEDSSPMIKSVRLGPTINDDLSQKHMREHMDNHWSLRASPIHVSHLPYHQRGQKPVPKPVPIRYQS